MMNIYSNISSSSYELGGSVSLLLNIKTFHKFEIRQLGRFSDSRLHGSTMLNLQRRLIVTVQR